MSELWDVYDCERKKTGRVAERGKPLPDGGYHLVVQVWIRNKRGEWLISRRTPNKSHPLKWEATGGSALAGEESREAALREVREELGISLDPNGGRLLFSERNDKPDRAKDRAYLGFLDVWVFRHDCPIESVVLQESETCGAMWADVQKIRELIQSGEFTGASDRIPPLYMDIPSS